MEEILRGTSTAIGIPEAISDGVSNITMHQLLRVLYSDQLTPIQRIFRVEPFDTWQTRQGESTGYPEPVGGLSAARRGVL